MDSLGTAAGQLADATIQHLGTGLAGHLADHRVRLGSTRGFGWGITTMAHRRGYVASASCGCLAS